jgi:hypothetical protein
MQGGGQLADRFCRPLQLRLGLGGRIGSRGSRVKLGPGFNRTREQNLV